MRYLPAVIALFLGAVIFVAFGNDRYEFLKVNDESSIYMLDRRTGALFAMSTASIKERGTIAWTLITKEVSSGYRVLPPPEGK